MLDRLLTAYCRLLRAVMFIALLVMVAMVFGNVVLRYAFNSGIAVSEELSRWLFVWLVFLGAAVAVHEHGHMGSEFLVDRLGPRARRVAVGLGLAAMGWATWLVLKGAWVQTLINWDSEAPVTGLSQGWLYVSAVVFGVSTLPMLALQLWRLVRHGQLPQGRALAE